MWHPMAPESEKEEKPPHKGDLSSLFSNTPREIRTPDLRIRSPALYPAELWARMRILLKKVTGEKSPVTINGDGHFTIALHSKIAANGDDALVNCPSHGARVGYANL